MKNSIFNNLYHKTLRVVLSCAMVFCCMTGMAQITQVHGTVSDDLGPLMGATVCEIDGTGRIINSALTDMNGNFTMKVKNEKDKIRFSFVGLKTQSLPINKTNYDIVLANATQLQEVVVRSKKRTNGSGLAIPEDEISYARQSLSTKEFEGLGITTIDEALQGRIAGLDIVGNSGALGSGSTMRLRGSGSLSTMTSQNPLIVVDGNIRDVDLSNFDASSASQEQFADLLNINAEDIADIVVLKDASATAIYGSQGGNGVIELITKRGARGKPSVSYSLKLTGTYQPKGMDLLSGDDYTMLLKESYFNPKQNDAASQNVPEINYTGLEARQYDDNTDWLDQVTQWGLRQNHYLTVEGGGERALFRISGGFDHETGTSIEDKMHRFSTRVNLDYNVSDRIRVQTNFSMLYTKYNHNYDNLYGIALNKMPNMSIYEEDANGVDTDVYYNMLQSGTYIGSEVFKDDQRTYVNPVASAHLAKYDQTKYDLTPELVLKYELWGMEEGRHRLTWEGRVYMNIYNTYNEKFYPSELVSTQWASGHNLSNDYSSKSVSLTTKHTLTFTPAFKNTDHSLSAMGRFELSTGSSNWQNGDGKGLPTGGITSPNAGGLITGLGSGYSESRSMYFTFSTHYSYKGGRYSADFSVRADGTSKFGPDRRWGYFPSMSLRWNVTEEPFMKSIREGGILSMLSVRPSWGIVGSAPNQNYLYISTYDTDASYLGAISMKPSNLKLTNLRWEKLTSYNLGFDLNFFKDRLITAIEVYSSTRSEMLMGNSRVPSSSGYPSVKYYNTGKLRNIGWEFRASTNKLISSKQFSFDLNVNLGNNRSTLLEMDPVILETMNSTYNNGNREVLTRVQLDNPLNAIYGFRSKGVYMYQYETIKNMPKSEQQAFIDAGNTAPVALNSEGKIIRDDFGDPIRMMFNYTNDNSGKNYKFHGGDAIYEDINHDGQINSLDIVYLGSSLPKLTGGFGFTVNYAAFRLSAQFAYRVGVDIINLARLDAEAMTGNNNQSQAVNYRWRKEGDVTTIPRAMYGVDTNYNTLVSDRFVEDGSYLRCSYVQLSYALKKKQLKWLGLNKISFYLSANNPFVLTKYTGVDPDISAGGYSPAIDNGRLPRVRSYTLGMTVNF